jgi:hypothetical protein
MWVLTIYNRNKEVKCQKGIQYNEQEYVEYIARNFVNKFKQYRKGWDWSIMPLQFCKNVNINKLSLIKV